MKRFVINLSTAGIKLGYAVEASKGAGRPTTGYKQLIGVKSTPSLNPAPETLETTTLEETEWKTYIDGLKDMGGALEFTFNLTQELYEQWEGTNGLMEKFEAAKLAEKRVYFEIYIPDKPFKQSLFFAGNPSPMGLPETSVSSVLETTNYITPTEAPVWATSVEPTIASE